jgi:hypothetical protein
MPWLQAGRQQFIWITIAMASAAPWQWVEPDRRPLDRPHVARQPPLVTGSIRALPGSALISAAIWRYQPWLNPDSQVTSWKLRSF